MQTRTERCNETRYPCWCNFGAYSGLKVILRIYHKIELIPPVLTGPVRVRPRPRWHHHHPQVRSGCHVHSVTYRQMQAGNSKKISRLINILHFPVMLLKVSKASRFTGNRVVVGYILVCSLGVISFCHFCSPTVRIKPCDLHITEISMLVDIK